VSAPDGANRQRPLAQRDRWSAVVEVPFTSPGFARQSGKISGWSCTTPGQSLKKKESAAVSHSVMASSEPIAWEAEYKIEGDALDLWRRCRIVDLSSDGAEVRLLDAVPDAMRGRPVSISVKLRGELHGSTANDCAVRVEFVELTAAERKSFESLTKAHSERFPAR
jgi:hypothetical protein